MVYLPFELRFVRASDLLTALDPDEICTVCRASFEGVGPDADVFCATAPIHLYGFAQFKKSLLGAFEVAFGLVAGCPF
jgi:hypothetical protein